MNENEVRYNNTSKEFVFRSICHDFRPFPFIKFVCQSCGLPLSSVKKSLASNLPCGLFSHYRYTALVFSAETKIFATAKMVLFLKLGSIQVVALLPELA